MQENVTNTRQWDDCLTYISRRVKSQSFSTWLKPTRGEPNGNGDFKISVPNQFVADWIRSHYQEIINEAFEEVLGKRYEVIWVVNSAIASQDQTTLDLSGNLISEQAPKQRIPLVKTGNHNLCDRYRFETLVVGDFNDFAHAASRAVSEGPGMTKYNPLYIYGGTGLGKTHIAQAIGHEILESFPEKQVMYATSEKFTSDFISAITDRTVSDFTRIYRDVDVLIIDDIQFFSGKESTQEQFFHTFNSLYHSGKQIVLTSDRPPKEIRGLEERLLSRFSWGLVTDLQAPDMENRTAILYKKLESEGATLPEPIINYIADNINTNIRELEGALTRVLAYASMMKVPPNLDIARKVLADSISTKRRHLTIEGIQKKASEFFNIDQTMMTAKKKTANIAFARQVAMYLSRSLTDNSLKVIGREFGGRDHSTVIHACDLVTKRMSTDPSFRDRIDKISASLLY